MLWPIGFVVYWSWVLVLWCVRVVMCCFFGALVLLGIGALMNYCFGALVF